MVTMGHMTPLRGIADTLVMGRQDEGYAQKGIQINEWKSHPVRCSRTTGSEFWGYRGNDVF